MTEKTENIEEFGGSRYFLNIPAGVAHDPDLQKFPKAILIFGEIWSMLNVTGEFYMSNDKMAKLYNCSKPSIKRALKLLETKGLITRENIYKPGTSLVIHRKISTGPAIGSYMTPPSVHERTHPGLTDEPGVGSPVSQIIEHIPNRTDNRTLNSPQAKPGNPKGENQANNPMSDPIIKAIRARSREDHDGVYLAYKDYIKGHPDGGTAAEKDEWVNSIKSLYGWNGWDEERKHHIDRLMEEGKISSVDDLDNVGIPGMPEDVKQDLLNQWDGSYDHPNILIDPGDLPF